MKLNIFSDLRKPGLVPGKSLSLAQNYVFCFRETLFYIIKNNCDFEFYFNKTDVTPIVLDRGDEIVLANWPQDKHIICNINNDIPIKIPSHPYVLVNRSILCNCRIEADNHHLLESIAACDNKVTKMIMYFTINLEFTNYLDMIPNPTDSLPIIRDRMIYKQPLPLNLSIPHLTIP